MHSRHDLVVMRYDRHENRHALATRLQMPGHGRCRNWHVRANTRWHWGVAHANTWHCLDVAGVQAGIAVQPRGSTQNSAFGRTDLPTASCVSAGIWQGCVNISVTPL